MQRNKCVKEMGLGLKMHSGFKMTHLSPLTTDPSPQTSAQPWRPDVTLIFNFFSGPQSLDLDWPLGLSCLHREKRHSQETDTVQNGTASLASIGTEMGQSLGGIE